MEHSDDGQHRVFADSDTEDMKPRGEAMKKGRAFPKKTARTEPPTEDPNRRKYFQDAKRKGWRLIIRNLAFNTKKEDLQVVCSKLGTFTEIVLPRCKDPRYPESCAGFAFVQFKDKSTAKQAIEQLNMSLVNGRKVAVDWAIDKDTYETAHHEEKEKAKKLKEAALKPVKMEVDDEEKGENTSGSEESDEEDEDEEDSEQDEESKAKSKKTEKKTDRGDAPNEAIQQGRVVFVRNISYEVTDEQLKEALQSLGTIELAIICRYADSDHSKGSGFVYFATKEEADACLDASATDPGLSIDGRRVYAHRALPRNDAAAIEKENLKKKPKDKRNLHLLRVGVVRAGTASAKGMSDPDANKRAQLAQMAKAKLRNLHMFVSPTRLVVHNLPTSLTDKKLRSICFLAAGNPDAKITECRIWRDRSKAAQNELGKSRGFGFVAFSEHSDALMAIRNLNNNPETFTDQKRPIVEFSIENLSALRLRESRITKSKEKLDKTRGMSEKTRREVEDTKRELSSKGQKPLPSHMGPKIRHRDLKKNVNERGKSKDKKGAKRLGKRSRPSNMKGSATPAKKPRKSRQKEMTKYLALS